MRTVDVRLRLWSTTYDTGWVEDDDDVTTVGEDR